jgi:hypothetical protein
MVFKRVPLVLLTQPVVPPTLSLGVVVRPALQAKALPLTTFHVLVMRGKSLTQHLSNVFLHPPFYSMQQLVVVAVVVQEQISIK